MRRCGSKRLQYLTAFLGSAGSITGLIFSIRGRNQGGGANHRDRHQCGCVTVLADLWRICRIATVYELRKTIGVNEFGFPLSVFESVGYHTRVRH